MNSKERNKAFWFYDFSLLDKLFMHLRLHIVNKHADFDGKSILDVGSGYNALNLQYIKSKFKPSTLTALDLNLNTEQLKVMGIDSLHGNLEEGVAGDGKYDIILATAILEHIQNDALFLKSCFDHLNDGGQLIITTPSVRSQPVLEFLAYKIHLIEEVEIRDHKRYYNKATLNKLMIDADFRQEHITHEYFEIYMNNFVLAKKWN
jgi:2-polyprenyl-3-methyl-5-hydroxy-6-metoxy-1,4-benzoquinol methylase